MDQHELKLIDFITHLPSNVNPYHATAHMLETITHSPPSPPWARRLRIVTFVLMEIMLFQSSYLLYQRFRINKSPKVKCNNLGLVVVNVSVTSALAYITYAPLTIYVLIAKIIMDIGHVTSEAGILLIFGVKFFTVILGSWAFFWVCACQCAKLLWNSNLASDFDRNILKNFIKWGVSTFFVCAAIGPLFPIGIKYTAAYKNLREIESIVHGITSKLRLKGESYDPDNFSTIGLLSLLLPAKKLIHIQERLEENLREGQHLYFANVSFLSLVYLPLLITSLRALYKQSVSQAALDAAIGSASGGQSKESPISGRIRRQRQRLVYHAICVYLATSLHLPMLIYQIIISRKPGFPKSVEWQELTYQGFNFPLSISGNIILLILNLHSYLTFKEKDRRLKGISTPAGTDHLGTTLVQKLTIYGFGYIRSRCDFDDDDVELEDMETHDKERGLGTKDSLATIKTKGFDSSKNKLSESSICSSGIKVSESSCSSITS